MTLRSTTRYCPPGEPCPYPNAYWNGQQMVYGQGYASADDVVGHELTHGVTDYTSRLFYYYQSGAINESLSDVFGEYVDLTNGAGTDTAGTRWQIGEDLPGGAGRDMEDPPSFGDPDRMTSPNYTADPTEQDGGGVHTNSGVNNKAAFLITDGGSFNGRTVTGLGITKAARIYYEVAANLLTSASDYADLYDALPQACVNLVGTGGITSADCAEVTVAVEAVEMNLMAPAAQNPEAPVCPTGQSPQDLFVDDLENTSSGNWVLQTSAGSNEWYYPQSSNPYGFDATYATSGTTNFWGYDRSATADYSITMTGSVIVPAGSAYLRFDHAYGFEDGADAYDGGVLEYSTNAGATWDDAGPLLADNPYSGTIFSGFGNPLGGRSGFVRESNGYISTRAALGPLFGQSVRFRFRIGTDSLVDDYGWFVDDIRIYRCGTGPNNPPGAEAGGPLALSEGGPLQLSGSGSSDPDGDPLSYAWDLDGDGDFSDGVTGQSPTVSWSTLTSLGLDDGPASPTVHLRVADPFGASGTDTAGMTLRNAPPAASIAGPSRVVAGRRATWRLSARDPSPDDQAGAFGYRIDWNGDGRVDQTVTGGAARSLAHTFTRAGRVTIKATAMDKDRGASPPATKTIRVAPDTAGPKVAVISSALRLDRRGYVAVKVRCPSGEPAGCAVTLTLRTASKVRVSGPKKIVILGKATQKVRAGRTVAVKVKLSSTGRQVVRRLGRLRVKVTVVARDQARNSRTVTRTLTLRVR
jgi:hypothetical protein